MEQVKTKQKKKRPKQKIDEAKSESPDEEIESAVKITVTSSPSSKAADNKLKNEAGPSKSSDRPIPETISDDDIFVIEPCKNEDVKIDLKSNDDKKLESAIQLDNQNTNQVSPPEEILPSQPVASNEFQNGIKNDTQSKNVNGDDTRSLKELQSTPTIPNYKQLAKIIENVIKTELSPSCSFYVSSKVNQAKGVIPFSFHEIETLFGEKDLKFSRDYAVMFLACELNTPSQTNPLLESITEYQRARSRLIANKKKVQTSTTELEANRKLIWKTKNYTTTKSAKCEDGISFSVSYTYKEATFQESIFMELQNDLSSFRNKVSDIHSVHSHLEHFLKIKVDDMIKTAMSNDVLRMKEHLQILFWIIRASAWGYDKELRRQLRNWCCLLANRVMEKDDSLKNILFLLNHMLKIPQGIRWGLHIIQCKIENSNDIGKALCILETILTFSSLIPKQHEDDLAAAQEVDEMLWIVVDSDGEGTDVEDNGLKSHKLKESDILGLVRQVPFKRIFEEMMLIRNDGEKDCFCGSKFNGGVVLKVFAASRILLQIIRNGLISHDKYLELSKELCRIALHSVMYCSDLWETTSENCEANLIERVSVEYNNVFLAGWETISSVESIEMRYEFLSEYPFKLCLIENVTSLYKSVTDNLIVSDGLHCYYIFVTIANMAIARTEEDFIISAIDKLFEIGYISDFSSLNCGEWARTACGTILSSFPHLMRIALDKMPPKVSHEWFNKLPINLWRPTTNELIALLNRWQNLDIDLIHYLLKSLEWKCHSGLSLDTQRNVSIFLCNLAQYLGQPKKQPPEWMWECIIMLKLHLIEWHYDITRAPQPEDLKELRVSEKCLMTNFTMLLMSSWGHSFPQIFQNAAPLLVKLALSGRFTEVIHTIYYILPIISEQPNSITDCKYFKELLSVIIQAEKSYTKIAARLVTNDFPGPIIKLFADMIRFQLQYCPKYRMTSIHYLVSTWIHWLTSQDSWQSDGIIIYLIDVVLGCSFTYYGATVKAADIFKMFIQTPSSPKSPSSSSFSSWLWSSSSSFKGLIQSSTEAPFLSHLILWLEHTVIERDTGIWQKLVEKLSEIGEGVKVNIDKTLKVVGGGDSSGALIIYRSLQCAINTNINHPILTLLWQLFFYLYLDISFLPGGRKPVGPLFFQGIVNSRILSKAKNRLLEIKKYHENHVKDLSEKSNDPKCSKRLKFHKEQADLYNTFYIWIDENFFKGDCPDMYTNPFSSKMCSLIAGHSMSWTDVIDNFQMEKFQASSYPLTTCGDIENFNCDYPEESFPSNPKDTLNMPPSKKILQRLQTYTDPITTPLVVIEDNKLLDEVKRAIFRDEKLAIDIAKNHLKEIQRISRNYFNFCHDLYAKDSDLYRILPTLYEKKRYMKHFTRNCGVGCKKIAEFNFTGVESILSNEVELHISLNREKYQDIVSKMMEPYTALANHTSVINKLASFACSELLTNETGIILFNTIFQSINEYIQKCPPAKQILNTIVTNLGEKFVSTDGKQFNIMINKYKDFDDVNLVSSLLRPKELSNEDAIAIYGNITSSNMKSHVAFSCLSKFHMKVWLADVKPTVPERSQLLSFICDALGSAGCQPPQERESLQELMCMHLNVILSWEFPVHLNQVLMAFGDMSIERKLPPDCWEFCNSAIDANPKSVSYRQAANVMELLGNKWWSRRNRHINHDIVNYYGMYIPAITRLGALLSSTTLTSVLVHDPVLLSHQVASVVYNAMCSYWNPWLVPCPITMQSSLEPSRSPAVFPWGPNDTRGAKVLFDAFIETLLFCFDAVPGSRNEFLRLTWQWYLNHYPHINTPEYVLKIVHEHLSKLPWGTCEEHWITHMDLQAITKICHQNLPSCHAFILGCLGKRKWTTWINSLPPPLRNSAIAHVCSIIIQLRPDVNVINDALLLPWDTLKFSYFEDVMNCYMNSFSNPSKPFYSDDVFMLICVMAGLNMQTDCNKDWQIRRISLIKSWINGLSSYCLSIIDPKQKTEINNSIGDSVTDLLTKIEWTTNTLVGATPAKKSSDSLEMFNTAIMMLNLNVLQEIAINRWKHFIIECSLTSIESIISCILCITEEKLLLNLVECTLAAYFEKNGSWSYVLNCWKSNFMIPSEDLVYRDTLLTSITARLSLDPTNIENKSFNQTDKRILQKLNSFEATTCVEEKLCLWICYMVSLFYNPNLTNEDASVVLNETKHILEKWSQDPSWDILRSLGLTVNVSTSVRFRIVTKYAYCAITDLHDKTYCNGSGEYLKDASYCKMLTTLETAVDHKNCVDEKHIITNYMDFIKKRSNTRDNISERISSLCSELYQDAKFLLNTSEIFQNLFK